MLRKGRNKRKVARNTHHMGNIPMKSRVCMKVVEYGNRFDFLWARRLQILPKGQIDKYDLYAVKGIINIRCDWYLTMVSEESRLNVVTFQ